MLQTVNVGDLLGGTVDAANCSGGGCDWTITVVDSTLSHSSTLTELAGALGSETDDNYTYAFPGALEIWNMSGCSELTGGPHPFSQVSFKDNTGSAFSPSWFLAGDGAVTPQCKYGKSSSASTNITLTDSLAPVLTVSISGPDGVVSGNSGTWYSILGLPGTSPYTYDWSGLLSGSSSSISGSPTSSGYLYLRVIDAAADTAYASLYVTVCPSGQIICP